MFMDGLGLRGFKESGLGIRVQRSELGIQAGGMRLGEV